MELKQVIARFIEIAEGIGKDRDVYYEVSSEFSVIFDCAELVSKNCSMELGEGIHKLCFLSNCGKFVYSYIKDEDGITELLDAMRVLEGKYFPTVERINAKLYKLQYCPVFLSRQMNDEQWVIYNELEKVQILRM